jgi:hypothetical protein
MRCGRHPGPAATPDANRTSGQETPNGSEDLLPYEQPFTRIRMHPRWMPSSLRSVRLWDPAQL